MFFSEALGAHDLEQFDSGVPSLTSWLKESARSADHSGSARVRVFVADSGEVAGYYALAPSDVLRADVPPQVATGMPDPVPAILLAKLALHTPYQGSGNGRLLLLEALKHCLGAIAVAGGRVIVVDAIDDGAAAFYRHFGFRSLPDRPDRLYIKPSTVRKALAAA